MTTTDPGIAGIGVPTVYRAEVRTSIWSGSVSGSVIWLRLNDGSDSANFPPTMTMMSPSSTAALRSILKQRTSWANAEVRRRPVVEMGRE